MPEGSGLRIAARETGDDDELEIELSLEESPSEGDEVVEDGGARLFVDAEAARLLGSKLLDATVHDDHLHFDLYEHTSEA
jgi:Fe-S cluster assembly iron-binding protein IscA